MSSIPSDTGFTFLPQGALIQEFKVSGHNIVLGFPERNMYILHNTPYFGETIGRTTNRIKDGVIKDLNGKDYKLAQNEWPNCLHGGKKGWGKQDFSGPRPVHRHGKEGVMFAYTSPDGDEGFPGTVECKVWYLGSKDGATTVLDVEYEICFVGCECEETVVGATNHSYFNLAPGSTTIADTTVMLGTDQYLELDSNRTPSGKVSKHPAVPGPNAPFVLGQEGPAFDDCFVLDPDEHIPLDTRTTPLRRIASLTHPQSKFHLDILSTEPAFQFYTGEGIDTPALETSDGARIPSKGARSGIAIEPSRYVDAQRKSWRHQCLLRQGQIWGARSQYRAWTE